MNSQQRQQHLVNSPQNVGPNANYMVSAVSPCHVAPTKTRMNYVGSRTTPEQVNCLPTPYYNLETTRRAACNVTTSRLTFLMLIELSFCTQMH
jgi:hypothetical protein